MRKLNQIDQKFDKIDERFNKIDERFDKIDEKFDKIDLQLSAIDQKLTGHDQLFADIDEQLSCFREEAMTHLEFKEFHKDYLQGQDDLTYLFKSLDEDRVFNNVRLRRVEDTLERHEQKLSAI